MNRLAQYSWRCISLKAVKLSFNCTTSNSFAVDVFDGTSPRMFNRRSSSRVAEFKRAQIVFNDNRSRIVCIVVNSSEKGAMLRVREATEVPDTFDLHIDDKVHAAWIAWKGIGAVGVNWLD